MKIQRGMLWATLHMLPWVSWDAKVWSYISRNPPWNGISWYTEGSRCWYYWTSKCIATPHCYFWYDFENKVQAMRVHVFQGNCHGQGTSCMQSWNRDSFVGDLTRRILLSLQGEFPHSMVRVVCMWFALRESERPAGCMCYYLVSGKVSKSTKVNCKSWNLRARSPQWGGGTSFDGHQWHYCFSVMGVYTCWNADVTEVVGMYIIYRRPCRCSGHLGSAWLLSLPLSN